MSSRIQKSRSYKSQCKGEPPSDVQSFGNQTVLVILCGVSCSGKTYSKSRLEEALRERKYPVNMIISSTTRIKRDDEVDGEDYHFLSARDFENKAVNGDFIEYSFFNGNYYGTDKTSIKSNCISIGILNPQGVESVLDSVSLCNDLDRIIVIHISASRIARIWRAFKRDGNSISHAIARMRYDDKAFAGFNQMMLSRERNEKDSKLRFYRIRSFPLHRLTEKIVLATLDAISIRSR